MLIFFINVCFIPSIVGFEFNNLSLVERIVKDISYEWKISCIFIIESPTYTRIEQNQLQNMHKRLAKSMDKHPAQVLSLTFNDFISKDQKAIRSCEKSVKVVMVGNGTRDEVEELSQRFQFKNLAWLFFMNSSLEEFFDGVNLNVESKILAVDGSTLKYNIMYGIYKVAPEFPVVMNAVHGIWVFGSEDQVALGGADTGIMAIESRSDLSGIAFRVISVENWPVTTFLDERAGQEVEVDGYFGKIWKELEESMNFTSIIHQVMVNDSGISTDFRFIPIGLRMNADFLLAALTLTPERLKSIDYLLPLIKSNMQVYFRQHGYQVDWMVVLRPFGTTVWITLAFWVLIGSLALFATSTVAETYGISSTDKALFPTPIQSFFFVVQTISFQGSFRVPRCITVRLLFLLCYLMATVLLPFYSASLISSLTKKQPLKPFDEVEGIRGSDHKLLIWAGTSDEEYFAMSDDATLQSIYKSQVILKNYSMSEGYSVLYKDVCKEENGKIALFAVDSIMDAITDKFQDCEVIKFTKPIYAIYEGMGIKKGSPYREITNYNLLRLWEAGRINRYSRMYMRTDKNKKPTKIEVTIYDVAETFCILAFGMILSLIIVALEVYNRSETQLFSKPPYIDGAIE